jgi:hypothetical protein
MHRQIEIALASPVFNPEREIDHRFFCGGPSDWS